MHHTHIHTKPHTHTHRHPLREWSSCRREAGVTCRNGERAHAGCPGCIADADPARVRCVARPPRGCDYPAVGAPWCAMPHACGHTCLPHGGTPRAHLVQGAPTPVQRITLLRGCLILARSRADVVAVRGGWWEVCAVLRCDWHADPMWQGLGCAAACPAVQLG